MERIHAGNSYHHSISDTFEHDSSIVKIQSVLPESLIGLNVLDVGCGDGRLSSQLINKGCTVTGLEIHRGALKKAAEKGLKVIEQNIELPWDKVDGSYDIILILDCLEHVNRMDHVVKEAKKKLAKGGKIIIAFPNHFDIRNRLHILLGGGIIHWSHKKYEERNNHTIPWDYCHVRFLTLEQLQRFLESVALYPQHIQFNFMGGGIVPTRITPRWFRRMLLRKLPNLFSGKFVISVGEEKGDIKHSYLPKTVKGM